MSPGHQDPPGSEDPHLPGGSGADRLDLRLVPVLAAAWAGAAVLVACPPPVLGAAAVLAVVVAGASLRPVRGRRRARPRRARGSVAAGAVVVAAVAVSTLLTGAVHGAGLLPQLAAREATARVELVVTGDPRPVRPPAEAGWRAEGADPQRWAVRARAERASGLGLTGAARAPVLVLGGPAWAGVRRGQRVEALGRVTATARADDVRALVLARAPPSPLRAPHGWSAVVADLRAGLQRACAPLGDDAGGLLPGLVVGDTSALPLDLEEAMRRTGLTHLTAVSGTNVSLVVGAALVLAAAGGAGRRARLAVAGAALLLFAGVAGPEPSVLRASAMGVVALLGLSTARRGAGVPAVCAAGAVLLVADPWLARSAGFALSVLATGALLVLARPWAQALARVLPRWLALAVAVPVAAQAVCGPVVLLLSEGVPLTAVPANLLVAPAVGPATVLGLAAAVVAPWWPGGARALARVGGLATGWIALVARTAAALPGTTLPWPSGWLGATALAAATALALALGRLAVLAGPAVRARAGARARARASEQARRASRPGPGGHP